MPTLKEQFLEYLKNLRILSPKNLNFNEVVK